MAFDYRALVSNGFWNEDDTTASERGCLLLSHGLWDDFYDTIVVAGGHRIRIIGFQFDGKLIG